MASELKPCQLCGALPCDWVDDPHKAEVGLCWTLAKIREVLGVGEKPMLDELPGIIAKRLTRPAPEYAGLVERTLTDTQRLLWRVDVEAVCPSIDMCFEYGETVRCGPCAIAASRAKGIEPNMSLPNLPEVSRLTRENAALTERNKALEAEVERLREDARSAVINTPETTNFMAGVPLEAAHQRDRWGSSHDAGKSPFDWFWLIGYLAQKAADAQVRGDNAKALHHTISTAAALANWHAAITGADTSMRPGIAEPALGDRP